MNDHISTDSIIDFIHGELGPADDARTHAHLSTCADCRRSYEGESSLGDALRVAVRAGELEMPSLVAAAVWQQIREAQPGPFARLAAFLRPAIAVPAGVLLVLGGLFASPWLHQAPQPTIDAVYYLRVHEAGAAQAPFNERSSPQANETVSDDTRRPPLLERANSAYDTASILDLAP